MLQLSDLMSLGFTSILQNNLVFFQRGGYVLTPFLGKWLVCTNFNGQLLLTDPLIGLSTLEDLKRHYLESTGVRI